MEGILATAAVRRRFPTTMVLVLTLFEEPEVVFQALRSGAVGYLLKSTEPQAIVDAIEEVGAHGIRRARAFGGYSGWGGGQLEDEIGSDAWIDVEPQVEDVFTEHPEGLWRAVLERAGGSYRLMAAAPEDPLRN